MQKKAGVAIFSALIKELPKENETFVDMTPVYSRNEHLHSIVSPSTARREKTFHQVRQLTSTPRGLYSSLQKIKLVLIVYHYIKQAVHKVRAIRKLKLQNFDVFHPTYNDPYFLPYLKGKPFVITIHDMIYELFPEYFGDGGEHARRKTSRGKSSEDYHRLTKHKRRCSKTLGIDSEKIIVVHHANFLDVNFMQAVPVPLRYILHVGGRKRWKNFDFDTRTCARSQSGRRIISDMRRGGMFDESERMLFKELFIHTRVEMDVSDSELVFLYRHAEFFVSASLYEGFGIPIVEAFANGCPVMISDVSCFPEIAGDAALYFDPKNRESITVAIQRILSEPGLRETLILKGTERLRNFSKEKMIRETLRVYEDCCIRKGK